MRSNTPAPPSPAHSTSSDDFAESLEGMLQESEDDQPEIEPDSESDNFAEFLEDMLHESEDGRETELDLERMKRRKLDETCNPDVGSSKYIVECEHPGVFGSMCFKCGKHIKEDGFGIKLRYIHKDLKLHDAEITRVRDKHWECLIRHKKLYLVLDLDHTLMNSTFIKNMSKDEVYIMAMANPLPGSLFRLPSYKDLFAKLRPFVHNFLKEVNKMYDMYIYTMGENRYAHEVVNLLDPKKEYFVSKVISRDESTKINIKCLDLLMGQEKAIIILDDNESVWADHTDNLILIEKYHFFASSLSCAKIRGVKSFCQLKSDESEKDGALASALDVLRQIHAVFYDGTVNDMARRDVRQVLRSVASTQPITCKGRQSNTTNTNDAR